MAAGGHFIDSTMESHLISGVQKHSTQWYISSGKSVTQLSVKISDEGVTKNELWSRSLFLERYLTDQPTSTGVYSGSQPRICQNIDGPITYRFNNDAHADVSRHLMPRSHLVVGVAGVTYNNAYGLPCSAYVISEFYNGERKQVLLSEDDLHNWRNSPWLTMIYV